MKNYEIAPTPFEQHALAIGSAEPASMELTTENLLCESLRVVRRAMATIHKAAAQPSALESVRKGDGSPVTAIDQQCEREAREHFATAFKGIGFNGEEFEPLPSENGYEVIMDPLDGTSAFLSNEAEKVGVNLAVRHHSDLVLAVVGNPATGEMVYTQGDEPTRWLRVGGLYGSGMEARTLPDRSTFDDKGPRLMTRFRRGASLLDTALLDLWEDKSLRHLVSPGGSPAWHLAEAAKGEYVYLHDWVRPSAVHDLTAKKLVENAGGKVVNLGGDDIPLEGFKGTFLAGVDRAAVDAVADKLKARLLFKMHHG